jgi:serine/threonine protein kinase/Tfp pilus assembly protein PilF
MIAQLQESLGDRYRVEREIARGGMATVYLAADTRHDRTVALKVMHPEVALALGRERFLHEIRLAARLSHPNLLTLHDSGEAGDFLYYVMPYVEGETLRQRINEKGRLDIDEAIRLVREAAEAIGYAHSLGIIHRDIKPENILLSRGHAVVADFGIARAIDVARDDRITTSGVALGTPAYMSPEQALAENVDARSDVWALGCLLYETLTGKPPFGSGGREILTRALTGRPDPITQSRPDVPEELDAIVNKALARSPDDRYANATELAEALDTFRTAPTIRVERNEKPRWTLAVAAIAIVAFLAIAVYFSNRGVVSAPPKVAALESTPRLSTDSAARELYRLARAQIARRTSAGSARAIALLTEAIGRDPKFGAAWADLARSATFAYQRAFVIPGVSRDSLKSLSVSASERAIELNPDDPLSWLVKERVSRLIDPVDFRPAIFALKKSLSMDSTNADAWYDRGIMSQNVLDDAGAIAAWTKAATLNPVDVQTLSFIGLHYMWNGEYAKATPWVDSAVALDPTFVLARDAAGQAADALGRPEEAVRHYEAALQVTHGVEQAEPYAQLARTKVLLRDIAGARAALARSEALIGPNRPTLHQAVYLAAALAALGDTTKAVKLLSAYDPRGDLHFQLHLKRDPPLHWLSGKWGKGLLAPEPDKSMKF